MEQLSNLSEQIIVLLFGMAGLLATPLIFIGLDYRAGIRKAKKRGERISSNKMKRTADKVAKYYNAILALSVVDAIQICAFIYMYMFYHTTPYTLPVFTFAAVVGVAAIEIKSILEPADQKEARELKEVAALAKAIAEHKNDPKELAESIATYLRGTEKEVARTILDKDEN